MKPNQIKKAFKEEYPQYKLAIYAEVIDQFVDYRVHEKYTLFKAGYKAKEKEEKTKVHFGRLINGAVATSCGADIVESLEYWSHTVKGITCNKCVRILTEKIKE